MCFFFFFFQAEDGIRDLYVTGVQTCALPICSRRSKPGWSSSRTSSGTRPPTSRNWRPCGPAGSRSRRLSSRRRSEERRVGKSVDLGGRRIIKKKKKKKESENEREAKK